MVGSNMEAGEIVVLYLHSPKERIWGQIKSLNEIGVTLRGIDINSFEDWCRQIAKGEEGIGLTTTLYPIYRIEKIIIDEEISGLQSLRDKFQELVGISIENYLSE
jgi:hypothetical protein